MWRFLLTAVLLVTYANGQSTPRSGDELVSTVLDNCIDMGCVKQNVLGYLDNVLELKSDVRNAKNIDTAIFKRTARILQTHELKFKIPDVLMEKTEIVYNPKSGLDIVSHETEEESRALGLKKKLLFPVLLLLKLKMKLLMPLFVALIGLKATKALILSKLAILIVLGFIIYQFMAKSGMPMPMMMAPAEPPASLYGPAPSTAPPSSYEPGWEPNQGGPYQRVWSGNSEPQSLAYSAYYPGTTASSSTSRP
ncbi:DUF1676 domain-containing protein Osi20 [Leptinotarsa decemlineata]|uniref:DUF1676 domain-containing protein Osi20 n=1 Tax=Leptinotarsa decemlineata TaxID=7539 RepID=UPI000C254E36|nr:uncharacterized protein LOC111515499 [Leptinotarsa decemlineata]